MAQFDPSTEDVETVLKKLDKADKAEQRRILTAEASGKSRKTILEPYGIDPNARFDATGRQLYPWEVTGKDMADADRNPEAEETDEARAAREAQIAVDEAIAAGTPDMPTGSTPAGSGTAPAAPRPGPTGGGTTTATTSGGAPTA